MAKKKYGLETRKWTSEFRAILGSLEGYMGSAGFSGQSVARNPSELFAVLDHVYGFKSDMMASFEDRVRAAQKHVSELPRPDRRDRQSATRAAIKEHGLAGFAKIAAAAAGSVPMPDSYFAEPVPRKKAIISKPAGGAKDRIRTRAKFYKSWEWRTVRMEMLKTHGLVCMCCGAKKGDTTMAGEPVKICVDHIKPLATHWHLRLDPDNLQVLCDECNQGKGAWDETDWRAFEAIETQLKYVI